MFNMFKTIVSVKTHFRNFISALFFIKRCKCDDVDEHVEFYTEVPEPEVPVHEEVKSIKPMHCGSHLRYRRSCPACAATRG